MKQVLINLPVQDLEKLMKFYNEIGFSNYSLFTDDNPSIGILLCKSKDRIEVEYALRDINKPMGISEYRLTDAIPENH